MSTLLDRQYISLLAPRLKNFRKASDNVFRFRCPLCGDSQKKKSKARGYVYLKDGKFLFHCHNCLAHHEFAYFLKTVDPELYNSYRLDRYREKKTTEFAQEVEQKPVDTSPIEKLLLRVDAISEVHRYVLSRRIPTEAISRLAAIEDIGGVASQMDKYKNLNLTGPRLAIPYRNRYGDLFAISFRSLTPIGPRYLNFRLDPSMLLVFGLDQLDPNEHIYVVEGPLDSLFLPNCIAASGMNFTSATNLISRENCTLVGDNQPRNSAVVEAMQLQAERGYAMVVWPSDVSDKDINSMIMSGRSRQDVLDLVRKNTYSGLSLKLAITQWRKT